MKKARDDESPEQTLDRNWIELLQELRVTQTGVQLLTGFLLTLPFQQRFEKLSEGDRRLYLTAVALSALATLLLIAPVPLHRVLFRQHEREMLVGISHWCALLGSLVLAGALVCVNSLIFGVVSGDTAGTRAAAVVAALSIALWVAGPLVVRFVFCRKHD